MSNKEKSVKPCLGCDRPTEIQGTIIPTLHLARKLYPVIQPGDLPIRSRVRACGYCGHTTVLPPEIQIEETTA